MIPIVAASIPPDAFTSLKTAAVDRSRLLPTFAQAGASTQNATIELVVWVCGFLIVVVIAAPFIHKYIKKLRECEEPVDKDAMLADFRAAYRAGQMDDAEFRRITELINNPPPANPASLKAASPRSKAGGSEIDPNPIEPATPVIENQNHATAAANEPNTESTVTTAVESPPPQSIDMNLHEQYKTPPDPSATDPQPAKTLVDSETTRDA